jgi:uncharacterized membrane protein YphA (DoxX/SURF4 family)
VNVKKVLESISRIIKNKYILLGTRLILGATFIVAASGKIPEQAKFVDVVTGLGLLPWELAQAYGLVLPWLELTLGICLVLGFLSRLAAGISILTMISLIVANGTAVYEYHDLSLDCSSCSGYILVKTSDALIIDVVMIALAFAILLCGGGGWSLDSLIRTKLKRPMLHKRDILEVIELPDPENTKAAPLSKEQSAEEAKEPPKIPEPTATGNEQITILKHNIYRKGEEGGEVEAAGVELVIKNVSDVTIGSALFEAALYDKEGNTLDTVEHKTVELQTNISRTIRITSSGPARNNVESYNVRIVKIIMPPEPTATGNEKITILKHEISRIEDPHSGLVTSTGVELAARNVSNSHIATAVFEAIFYDIEGNIVDTVKHREIDLKPNTSRAISISYTDPKHNEVKSYDVRLIRTTTADVEKVQLRRHELRTTEAGEEELWGIVKNISEVKTDAALVATFYDPKKENIATKVIILRDIEPNSIRQYVLKFKPQEGDIVRTYTLNIGEIVE